MQRCESSEFWRYFASEFVTGEVEEAKKLEVADFWRDGSGELV